jgi:hypothetical protein
MWRIVGFLLSAVVLMGGMAGYHNITGPALETATSSTLRQIETGTVPSGYFALTVSPAQVCAHVGEKVEICCTIDTPLVNTPIEITSVAVLLFDSHDSIIREQTMTTWDPQDGYHYLSASTEYTVVGDEAYYKVKVNFTFPLGPSGEYAQCTAHSFPIVVDAGLMPIEITSVVGPIAPYNPGGPVIDVTVKNVAPEPVVSLTATLQIPSGLNTVFGISFNVTPSNPLLPGGSVSARRTLIGGGIRSGDSYPLTIDATLQDGAQFVYTTVVQIAGP